MAEHTLAKASRVEREIRYAKWDVQTRYLGVHIFGKGAPVFTGPQLTEAVEDRLFEFDVRMMELASTIVSMVARQRGISEVEAKAYLGQYKAWHALINSGISDPKLAPYDDIEQQGPLMPIRKIMKLAKQSRIPLLAA